MKKITIELDEQDIDRAIKELDKFKENFQRNVEKFESKIANRIADLARSGFNTALFDDLLSGGSKEPDVSVYVEKRDNLYVVVADGEDAIWIEFGAGVYHNGSVGTSPHPSGAELGFTIGSYGDGKGARPVWGYYEDGKLQLTHGTPASMPMNKALIEVVNEIPDIAREVFK